MDELQEEEPKLEPNEDPTDPCWRDGWPYNLCKCVRMLGYSLEALERETDLEKLQAILLGDAVQGCLDDLRKQ
jgi:hypothetical protein